MYLYNLGISTLKTFSLKSLFVAESLSKLVLLTTRQANESKRRGVEARKTTLFGMQLTKKMAVWYLKISILSRSGCQVIL